MKWQYCGGFSTAIVIPNEGGVKVFCFFYQGMKGFHIKSLNHISKRKHQNISHRNLKLIISWSDGQIIQSLYMHHKVSLSINGTYSCTLLTKLQNIFLILMQSNLWFWIWAKHSIYNQCMLSQFKRNAVFKEYTGILCI